MTINNLLNESGTMENKSQTFGNFGERQEAESKNWGYYAHLSIYKLASQFAKKKDFLEIGCGTGYGAHYLADLGVKSYTAIDKDPLVVEALSKKYKNISFESIDLDLYPLPFDKQSFDFIFSSNVFEHIAYIDPVLTQCNHLLRENGMAVIAVPPIITSGMLAENAKNFFHINNIPPWAWVSKLNRYFKTVEYYRHWVKPDCVNQDNSINMTEPKLDDFIFERDFDYLPSTITSVFLCKDPLINIAPFKGDEDCPLEWSAAKVSAEARQVKFVTLSSELKSLEEWWRNEISNIYSWAENNKESRVDNKIIVDGIMRQMANLNGKV